MKKYIKCDDGKVSQVLEFDSGNRVELPLDRNGSVKWLKESVKSPEKNISEEQQRENINRWKS